MNSVTIVRYIINCVRVVGECRLDVLREVCYGAVNTSGAIGFLVGGFVE